MVPNDGRCSISDLHAGHRQPATTRKTEMSGYQDDDVNPNYQSDDWYATYRFDRPLTGLYDKGQVRVITSINKKDGSCGACHLATEEDLKRLEHIHSTSFTPEEWAHAIANKR